MARQALALGVQKCGTTSMYGDITEHLNLKPAWKAGTTKSQKEVGPGRLPPHHSPFAILNPRFLTFMPSFDVASKIGEAHCHHIK